MSDDIGRQLRRFKGFTNRAPGDGESPPRSYPLLENMADNNGNPGTPGGALFLFIIDILFWGALPLLVGAAVIWLGRY